MEKKNKIYWDIKSEELINNFLDAEDSLSRNIILRKVTPNIKKILSFVLYRYYGGFLNNTKTTNDILTDCFNHTIIKLIYHYHKEKGKAYSYISTIAKRYYYNIFIRKGNYMYNLTDFIEEKEFFEPSIEYYQESETFQEDKSFAIEKLISEREKLLLSNKKYRRNGIKYNKIYLLMIEDFILYLKNNNEFSLENLFVMYKDKYENEKWFNTSLTLSFLKNIGFSNEVYNISKKIRGGFDKTNVKDIYQSIYMYDDYTPSEKTTKYQTRYKYKKMYDL